MTPVLCVTSGAFIFSFRKPYKIRGDCPGLLGRYSTSKQNGQISLALIVFQTGLKSQIIEKKSELQSVQSVCDTLRGKLICRDEELDDVRCQFTAVNNALEVFI